ncbi:MAG: DUF3592 domain-containing protein [Chloroflexota bacterium]|nr:DUF3592 domain-containing protein [Chloroflexota bacterium]
MNTEQIIIALSICGSLVVVDAIFLGIILFTRRKVTKASTWLSTLGTVTESRIQMRSNSEGGRTSYPLVRYTYQVMERSYQSQKVVPGMDVGGSGAQKVVARYPVGAQVMVYYNPEDPSEALLERGMPGHIKWLWIILAILNVFLCGLGAALFFIL